jgi:hypothetical protein
VSLPDRPIHPLRWLLACSGGLLLAAVGCSEAATPTAVQADVVATDAAATGCSGTVLFGTPGPKTGLDNSQCQPSCSCGGATKTAVPLQPDDLQRLRGLQLAVPLPELTSDPYLLPAPPVPADAVCGVVLQPAGQYALQDFASVAAAKAAGAVASHSGVCGLCSTLADLAVYAEQPDLTDPVRDCGLVHAGGEPADHVACLQALGFTKPCAQIWYWNTLHTREQCGSVCLKLLSAPYHEPDGSLNECLQCDEDQSGPVFKAVAGRTRRNTGLASNMCRPCSEVQWFDHRYGW